MHIPETLYRELSSADLPSALRLLSGAFPGKVVFSTSLGTEDQLIAHHIFTSELPIRVFTLDTGRLFPETYSLLSRTRERYGTQIEVYFPNAEGVQNLMTEKGPNSFYLSVENRKECCAIRKMEPLQRALKGAKCWITGLRADQSPNRSEMSMVEKDESHGLIKVHPLLHWTEAEVRGEIEQLNIPYNPLHDKGFVSIGCAPCTRAIRPGEDFRSGRWWWEDDNKKECGLHELPNK